MSKRVVPNAWDKLPIVRDPSWEFGGRPVYPVRLSRIDVNKADRMRWNHRITMEPPTAAEMHSIRQELPKMQRKPKVPVTEEKLESEMKKQRNVFIAAAAALFFLG